MGKVHPVTLDFLADDIAEDGKWYADRIEKFLASGEESFSTNTMYFNKAGDQQSVHFSTIWCDDDEQVATLSGSELSNLIDEVRRIQQGQPKALSIAERQDRSRKGVRRK
ncbi:MAG: hypothetical protein QNJ20_04795 [Paracoccaceae bacterium]|nr:hypothetical protein [Paracoccaceae bacterium]